MKILIVIDTLASGGAQRLKGNLAKSLVDSGHEVELFIYDLKDDFFASKFQSHGVKIHAFEKEKKGFSLFVVQLLALPSFFGLVDLYNIARFFECQKQSLNY